MTSHCGLQPLLHKKNTTRVTAVNDMNWRWKAGCRWLEVGDWRIHSQVYTMPKTISGMMGGMDDGLPCGTIATAGSVCSFAAPKIPVVRLPSMSAHGVSHEVLAICARNDAMAYVGLAMRNGASAAAHTPARISV